jgi:2-dehydro-3-deoxy-D-arabinonate dehydratase
VITPYTPQEIWGAGITYKIARSRYSEENIAILRGKTIYELIYESERPELFFKDTGRRCVGHLESISIRSDSSWTLPEPELGVILRRDGEVLGYTVTNDVSARDIEASNPLYLPQSKIYKGCCSFGPFVVTPDEISDPYSLSIRMRILRGEDVIYSGETSTSRMARRIKVLSEYLTRDNDIPDGTLLMTGTGLVPGGGIYLDEGDIVEISIEKIGTLVNPVKRLR